MEPYLGNPKKKYENPLEIFGNPEFSRKSQELKYPTNVPFTAIVYKIMVTVLKRSLKNLNKAS